MHVRGLQTGHCAPSAPLHAQQPSARLRQTHHRHAAARSASQSGGAAGASPPNVDVVGTAADTQATGTSPAASTSGRDVQYSYHSDGHYKATIEDVFGSGGGQAPLGAGKAPWRMGWQTNERNIMWNEDLKMRLLTVRPSGHFGATHARVSTLSARTCPLPHGGRVACRRWPRGKATSRRSACARKSQICSICSPRSSPAWHP